MSYQKLAEKLNQPILGNLKKGKYTYLLKKMFAVLILWMSLDVNQAKCCVDKGI